MKTRMRYNVAYASNGELTLLSKPIVIGTRTYMLNVCDEWAVILDANTCNHVYKIDRNLSLNAIKKAAKAKLIEMGATFSEEIRNRPLTKKNKNV